MTMHHDPKFPRDGLCLLDDMSLEVRIHTQTPAAERKRIHEILDYVRKSAAEQLRELIARETKLSERRYRVEVW